MAGKCHKFVSGLFSGYWCLSKLATTCKAHDYYSIKIGQMPGISVNIKDIFFYIIAIFGAQKSHLAVSDEQITFS